MSTTRLSLGDQSLELQFQEGTLVTGRRHAAPAITSQVEKQVTKLLNNPSEFPTLKSALTPDDHICLVIHEDTNELAAVMKALLEHIQEAGVSLQNCTVLHLPRQSAQEPNWYKALPASLQGFQRVEHERKDSALAYLASTKAGRRIYLNRFIVDADQLIVVGSARFDSIYGITTGLAEIFPNFSDNPTLEELSRVRHAHATGSEKSYPIWKEAEEVGWLLGMPFVVAVAEAAGGKVSEVFAGSTAAVREQAEAWLKAHAIVHLPYQVDLVIGTLTGSSHEQQLSQVLEAAYHASQVVHQGGVVAILSTASGTLPAGADMISSAESVVAGLTQVRRHKELDSLPWWHLAHALEQARVYVSSHFPAEVLESLFIIPMDQPSQVQQLINQAKSIVVVEGLDRTLLEVSRS